MWKRIGLGLLAVLVVAAAIGWFAYGKPVADVALGFAAKMGCSYHYVSGRSLDHIRARELSEWGFIELETHPEQNTVTAHLAFLSDEAVYRPGLGCTLVEGTDAESLADAAPLLPPVAPDAALVDEPDAEVQALIDAYMAQEELHTRALIVARGNRILGEGYGDGFDAGTPHQGWSMTKSITQALAGILVRQGRLDPDGLAMIEEWQDAEDPRSTITVRHLLTATDGLDFEEIYTPPSDATLMLFTAPSVARVAAAQPLAAEPGTRWSYSSGTTNLLAHLVGEEIRAGGEAPAVFARRELFGPLGMQSALIEQDSFGDFVGSSFGFMTARDWLRFGLLYLNDGVWNGSRILPEGWAADAARVTPESNGLYGQQWWLNDPEGVREDRPFPDLPPTLFRAGGFEGQHVIVMPEQNVVIVRLGYTPGDDGMNAFGAAVLDALGG